MRRRSWLHVLLVVAWIIFPLSLRAQFQAPSQDELKMTEEPKAPGAAAIYLMREEGVDDNRHFHSFYARIKVLSEKGKELATVGIPYPKGKFSVTDIKGRTIHADGTIIPLTVKPEDLMEAKVSGLQINRMVFTLPSVEVGSILEYKWQLRYDDALVSSPRWDVQQPYFVRKAHYWFVPFKYIDQITDSHGDATGRLLYSSMLPAAFKVIHTNDGRYELDVTDLLASPSDEYMPPIESMLAQVEFYYSPYISKDEFWKHEGSRWSKEMDHFADGSKPIKEAVNGIVAASDTEDQKARKIYDAVMKIENTDFTRRKTAEEKKALGIKATKRAEDVWTQKSGSNDQIALLYLSMARAAGLKAYAMAVANRNRRIFNPFFLSLDQLDDVIVIVSIGGKETLLDPGYKDAAFGQLAWYHNYAGGLRQSDNGPQITGTAGNIYKEAVTRRTATLTLDADGSVHGMVRISMIGPAALRWRHVALENDETEVKKQFDEYARGLVPDGVEAKFNHFVGLDDYHSGLMAVVDISGVLGSATGKRMFVPAAFFASHSKQPFISTKSRETPVDMEYASIVNDEVDYELPEGYTVESSPQGNNIPWSGHAAFSAKATVDKGKVTVSRSLAHAFTLLEAKEYSDLRDFYQKVAAADQAQLVLAASAGSKGN